MVWYRLKYQGMVHSALAHHDTPLHGAPALGHHAPGLAHHAPGLEHHAPGLAHHSSMEPSSTYGEGSEISGAEFLRCREHPGGTQAGSP